MYLLDTNIFLELLLDQEKADEVEKPFTINAAGETLSHRILALLDRDCIIPTEAF